MRSALGRRLGVLERRVPPAFVTNPETTFESLMEKLFDPEATEPPRRHPVDQRMDPISEALFTKLVGEPVASSLD